MHDLVQRGQEVIVVGGDAPLGGSGRAAVWIFDDAAKTCIRGKSPDFADTGQQMRGVAIAADGSFVAVGWDDEHARAAAWTSKDGRSWIRARVASADSSEMLGVARVRSQLFAVGESGTSGAQDARVWEATVTP